MLQRHLPRASTDSQEDIRLSGSASKMHNLLMTLMLGLSPKRLNDKYLLLMFQKLLPNQLLYLSRKLVEEDELFEFATWDILESFGFGDQAQLVDESGFC
jgi:hypothetical protein